MTESQMAPGAARCPDSLVFENARDERTVKSRPKKPLVVTISPVAPSIVSPSWRWGLSLGIEIVNGFADSIFDHMLLDLI